MLNPTFTASLRLLKHDDLMALILFIFVSFIITNINYAHLPPSQINALSDLYESLNGDQWFVCNWNITQLAINNTLPSWYCGLYIDDVSNNTQTVYALSFLFNNNLNGTIPATSIEKFVDLQAIQLWNNPLLHGIIPSTICNLAYFWYFDLVNVSVSGNVPSCIGNISTMEVIQFENVPLLSMSDNIIKSLCVNAPNMDTLGLMSINYIGSIPDCIGNKFSHLDFMFFVDLQNLNSTIPHSFNNLTVTQFGLSLLPNLYGTFPSDMFKNNGNLNYIVIDATSLSGNLPIKDLCNNTKLHILLITNNLLLDPFVIPACIKSLDQLMELHLTHPLIGTIPDSFCYLHNLVYLSIIESSITGIIPKCITYKLTELIYLDLHSNNLNGIFPSISSPQLKYIDIHNNEFSGRISSIFGSNEYTKLEIVILHQNNFYDNDIGVFIEKIFKYSPNVQAITIYDNDYIGGKFPKFSNHEIYLNKLSVFAVHKLNIGGIIPNNVHFANQSIEKSIISMYNNQLSSSLPSNLVNSQNITPIILRGNLFTILSDDGIPQWMDQSKFIDAKHLFITLVDIIKSWIILCVGFVSYIFILIKKKYKFIPYVDSEFICNTKQIDEHLCDTKLLLITFILFIFYPFSCSYYSSSPILSHFALFFFETKNIYIKYILSALIIIYNIIIINIITKIINKTWGSRSNQNIEYEFDVNNGNKKNVGLINDSMFGNHVDIDDDTNSILKNNFLSKLLTFTFYLVLYLISIFLLMLYILSESLPDNNTLHFTEIENTLLTHSIQIILAINTSLITPKFITSTFILFHIKRGKMNETKFIMITRTITTILIPITISILLLNECGNGWTKLWKPCFTENDKNSFNIKYPLTPSPSYYNYSFNNESWSMYFAFPPIDLDVLSASEVCSQTKFIRIKWNKCIRSFLYKWCNLLMVKMMVMFFMPLFILLFKTIKHNMYKNKECKKIKIDSEYSMITTKLEIILVFAIFCPLLYPMIIISINSFLFFYVKAITTLKWKIEFLHHSNGIKSFPFHYLWFGIFVEQFLTFIFFQSDQVSVDNKSILWILLMSYIIIDIYFIYKTFKKKYFE